MKRTISVVGSATVMVEPDIARLTCGVQVQGVNAQDALRRSNDAIHAILEAIKGAGVAATDLRTNGPHLYPTERGYVGNHDVSVIVRDLGAVGPVIDAVAAAGGPDLTMQGVSFGVEDPAVHLPAARRAAMAAARATADELATAGGAAVGEVVTISESSGYQAPVALRADMAMMKATPIEPGEQQLRIDVNVTYRLVAPD